MICRRQALYTNVVSYDHGLHATVLTQSTRRVGEASAPPLVSNSHSRCHGYLVCSSSACRSVVGAPCFEHRSKRKLSGGGASASRAGRSKVRAAIVTRATSSRATTGGIVVKRSSFLPMAFRET